MTLRKRDKRAMCVAHGRARWADAMAPIKDEAEIYEDAPDWLLNLYGETQSDDEAWRDAIASANGRSNEINGSRG